MKESNSTKSLGLDLGTNSLGWAILDNYSGDIIDSGVVIVPEGVDAGDSLETPAAARRAQRMLRRQNFRRKTRRMNALKILIENGMCPLPLEELDKWRTTGKYPADNIAFREWLKSTASANPYGDRAAAADGPVDPFTLGRALYHIAQRRGFKSSRKDVSTEDQESDGNKSSNSDLGKVKSGISDLTEEMKDSGAKTLGQHFYWLIESEKDSIVKTRIRGRYTSRTEHYEKEFDVIMDAQGGGISSEFRKRIHDAIFMQRPLRSQKHLVGKCPLEEKNNRAQIGHPAFEEFRMRAFVNNLSFVDANGDKHSLSPSDRELACTAFMKKSRLFKFKSISVLFKNDERFKKLGWRFHYYKDDESIPSSEVTCRLSSAFGDVSYDVQQVFDAITFFDDAEKFKAWIVKRYPMLDEESVSEIESIHPQDGYAKYSLKAINKILRFLRMGYELSEARVRAKLPDVIDCYDEHEDAILSALDEIKFEYGHEAYSTYDPITRQTTKRKPLLERYKSYLGNSWGVDEAKWNRLYLKGDTEYEPCSDGRLPEVKLGMIRNPVAQRSLTTLRRLVNTLLRQGKIDSDTTVRIELARTVNNRATRQALKQWQDARRKDRELASDEIEKAGFAATDDAIDRFVLWKEQGGICLYTGRQIGISDLLSGNMFDVEHTVPRSSSGDDSLANKTICESEYNRITKGGRVPRSCPNWSEIDARLKPWRDRLAGLEKNVRKLRQNARAASDPAAKSNARVKQERMMLELSYWKDKLYRFDVTDKQLESNPGELGGFKRRQLVDTGVMSKHAVAFLKSIFTSVHSVNGSATAFARKAWGIQQGDAAKDRSDHRHHAVDAMVIAALTPSRFLSICTALKDDGTGDYRRPCDVCRPPFRGFSENVRKACDEILVKHVKRRSPLKQSSKQTALAYAHPQKDDPDKIVKFVKSKGDTIRVPLHKDKYYGCIKDPTSGELVKVLRQELKGEIQKDVMPIVKKIVDPAIREIVAAELSRLESEGFNKIEPGMVKMPSGVPIRKVRIIASGAKNAHAIRMHDFTSDKTYKNPYYAVSAEGSNFRFAVFSDGNGGRRMEVENALSLAKEHKKDGYVNTECRPGFLGFVYPGSMALAHHSGNPCELRSMPGHELGTRLYKVVKYDSKNTTLRLHVEARRSTVLQDEMKSAGFKAQGESKIDFDTPFRLLNLNNGKMMDQMEFEGIDFTMSLDGTIKFTDETWTPK